jgi:hypothetical protein
VKGVCCIGVFLSGTVGCSEGQDRVFVSALALIVKNRKCSSTSFAQTSLITATTHMQVSLFPYILIV